jgi:hypothetical protein
MAYNNSTGGGFSYSRGTNSRGYSGNYGNNGGYRQFQTSQNFRNNQPGYYNQQQQPKKHSGCSMGIDKNGVEYVRGWKFDRRSGLRSFYATSYKNTKEVTSKKSGRVYENWMVRVQLPSGESFITGGLFERATGKVTISNLGFVMNPKGGRGGYVGTFSNK